MRVEGEGLVVAAVVPGLAAARAGVTVGDRITHADGSPVPDTASLGPWRAGVTVRLTVVRDGRAVDLSVVPGPRPWETHPDAEVVYGTVEDGGVRLRSIAARPRGAARCPCVVYLQGYDCASVERGGEETDPLRALVRALLVSGVGVYRLEKQGVGDSEGGPAEDVSLATEQAHFAAGLAAAAALPWVSSVVVFGHSLGGLHAPVLAARGGVDGVVVYGAGVRTWTEYLDANVRHQLALAGADPAAVETAVRGQQVLSAEMLVGARGLPEVLARHPALRGIAALGITSETRVLGRHHGYWQAVYAAPCVAPLRDLPVALLAAWGEADWLSYRTEHEEIAAVVDRYHPGHGRFAVVEGTDHWFLRHPTQAASFAARGTGEFNQRLADVLVAWIGTLQV